LINKITRSFWKYFLVLIFMLPLQAWAGVKMHSRNLNCEEFELARTRTICHALEREMKWQWFGHAIVSPGWRPTFTGVTHVFCTLPIDVADIPAIIPMTGWSRKGEKSTDWRLESGSQWLIFLVGQRALEYLPSAEMRKELEQAISNTTSIWNPSNPEYPLRNGCR
jgi:hypothetical protein